MTTDTEPPEHEKQRMRLSREVRIGELLLTVSLLSGVAAWYIDARIAPVIAQIQAVREAAKVQVEASNDFRRELRSDIRDLSAKIDRLAEQGQRR